MPFEEVTYWDELCAGVRLDADQRAFELQHLLGRAGGRASFPRHAEVSASREGVRRLPPPQPGAGLALSARLFRRLLDSGLALDRGAARRHSGRQRARGADGVGRGRTLPAATIRRIARCTCSITSSTTRARSPTSISATSRPASRSRCRATIFRRTIRRRQPENRWRSHAHLLFGNWINELYQTTPFDVQKIGATPALDRQGRGVGRRVQVEKSRYSCSRAGVESDLKPNHHVQ